MTISLENWWSSEKDDWTNILGVRTRVWRCGTIGSSFPYCVNHGPSFHGLAGVGDFADNESLAASKG
jgi:hypothetical protein